MTRTISFNLNVPFRIPNFNINVKNEPLIWSVYETGEEALALKIDNGTDDILGEVRVMETMDGDIKYYAWTIDLDFCGNMIERDHSLAAQMDLLAVIVEKFS